MRGDGYIYQRRGVWWACTFTDGRRVRESLHTADEEQAKKRLVQLRRAKDRGQYLAPAERRATVDDLLDDLLVHLRVKGAASAPKVTSHMKAVRERLGASRASHLDTAMVERAQEAWLKAGAAPATVNRRCEGLRQAFRLAARRTPPRVRAVPHIPLLKVSNARQGFISRADFQALRKRIEDPDVRDFVEWFYWTGMRPGEIRQLTWEMVDREAWTLNLDPRAAKIRRGRVLALEGPLRQIVDRRWKARRLDCLLVFHRTSKGLAGQPVLDFSKLWKAALKVARLSPGLVPYDLRRTALRNMVRAGIETGVAMKISGHRTRSTFDRYNIVDEQDVREAVIRTAAFVGAQPKGRKVRMVNLPPSRISRRRAAG
jgi:integrase